MDQRTISLAFCAIGTIVIIAMLIVLVFTSAAEDFPQISITSLQVTSAANTDNNNTLPQSSGAADIFFCMVLNNRADWIEYTGEIKASVYYQGNFLASTSLYPFEQNGKKEVTEKKVRMRSMNMNQIAGKTNSTGDDGVFSFDIYFVSPRTHIPTHGYVEMNVLCNGIRVKFADVTTSTGYMIGGPIDCSVDVENPPVQYHV